MKLIPSLLPFLNNRINFLCVRKINFISPISFVYDPFDDVKANNILKKIMKFSLYF